MRAAWVTLALFAIAAGVYTYAVTRRRRPLPPPSRDCERMATEARGRYQ